MKSATILCSALNFNRNVLYTFIYKFSDGIAQGVWSLASMATYIYLLENNSTRVTCLECDCISGASMMHATTGTARAYAVRWACSGHSGYFCSCVCNSRHVQAKVVYCCQSPAAFPHCCCAFHIWSIAAAGWLADRFRRDKVLKCCAVASCGELSNPPECAPGDCHKSTNMFGSSLTGLPCQLSSKQ